VDVGEASSPLHMGEVGEGLGRSDKSAGLPVVGGHGFVEGDLVVMVVRSWSQVIAGWVWVALYCSKSWVNVWLVDVSWVLVNC